jgi:hypothetical protein
MRRGDGSGWLGTCAIAWKISAAQLILPAGEEIQKPGRNSGKNIPEQYRHMPIQPINIIKRMLLHVPRQQAKIITNENARDF